MQLRPYSQFRSLWLCGLVLPLTGGVVWACPYVVRDSGFIVREPKSFQVLVCVTAETPRLAEVAQLVDAAAQRELANANVRAQVVRVDGDSSAGAVKSWKRAGSPKPPCAVLVSPRDEVLKLSSFAAGQLTEQALRSVFRRAATSPARRELLANVIRPWCTVLLATGADAAANAKASEVVKASVAQVPKMLREAKETRFAPPFVLTLARNNSAERVFLWSLGISSGREPAVAVLFGRGRRLGKLLTGERLTEESLSHELWLLGQNCTCTADPSWLLGPVAPLIWPQGLAQQVAAKLGFDPMSPSVYATLSGVWTTLVDVRPAAETKSEPELGFLEFDDEPTPAAPTPKSAKPVNTTVKLGTPAKSGAPPAPGKPTPSKAATTPPVKPAKPKPAESRTAKPEPAAPQVALPPLPESDQPATTDTAPKPVPAVEPPAEDEPTGADRFRATNAPRETSRQGRTIRVVLIGGAALILLSLAGAALVVVQRRREL